MSIRVSEGIRLGVAVAALMIRICSCRGGEQAILQFSSANYHVAENGQAAVLSVVRSGNLAPTVMVAYATLDGSAKAGTNYTAAAGTITFASGETNQTITVAILDNSVPDGDRGFQCLLSNPGAGSVMGARTNAIVTIVDNEFPASARDAAYAPMIYGSLNAASRQSDGTLILAGSLCPPGSPCTMQVMRLLPDGSRDAVFRAPEPGLTKMGYQASFSAVAVQADGKVIVAGSFTNLGSAAVNGIARLNSDGSVDTAFGTGRGVVDTSNGPGVETIAVQPDGKILLGGTFNQVNGVVRRYLTRLETDGSLDTNFTATANDQVTQIYVQRDGSVFLSGYFHAADVVTRYHIAHLQPDGSLDNTFQPRTAPAGLVSTLAVQPDGKVVIGGISPIVAGLPANCIARLNADGTVDTNFVPALVKQSPGNLAQITALAVQEDGGVLISGNFVSIGGVARANFARLNPDGSLDTNFNVVIDSAPQNLFIEANGDVLIAGGFSSIDQNGQGLLAQLHTDTARLHPIEFTTSSYTVNESKGQASISVRRRGESSGTVTIDYATSDGSAVAGTDYAPASGTVTFGSLETVKTFSVLLLTNALAASDETVDLTLGHPSAAAQLGPIAAATLTIRHDVPVPQFVPDSLVVNENDGTATVQILRSGDVTTPVTLQFWTSDGAALAGRDYLGRTGTVTFAAGQKLQSIQIPVLDNGLVDGTRTFNVSLSNSNLYSGPTSVGVAIIDNESPVLLDPNYNPGSGAISSSYYAQVEAVVAQPDGKLIIGGSFTNYNGVTRGGLARLNGDGSVDTSFDPRGGVEGGASGPGSEVTTLVLQPDGKVLVGGEFFRVAGRLHVRLARLQLDGSSDESFRADVTAISSGNPGVSSILLQPDGKILVCGTFTAINQSPRPGVARLESDGSVDLGFRSDLSLTSAAGPLMALQPDGKVLVGGSLTTSSGVLSLVRLNANGSLDPGFALSALPTFTTSLYVTAIAAQPDGKILVDGSWNRPDGSSSALLVRLNADGSFDSDFKVQFNTPSYARQITLLPDGKILLAGDVLRVLNPDGTLGQDMGLGARAALAEPDGSIITAGGMFSIGNDQVNGVVRLYPGKDQAGGPEFASRLVRVQETDGQAVLTVIRLGDSTGPMTVDFTTVDGTARAGQDYVSQHGTLHFAPLQVTNSVTVPIINDHVVDGDLSFDVVLSRPSTGFALQLTTAATVVITSNDTGIQFASRNTRVDESAGLAEVTVTRQGDDLGPVAVDYATQDGTAKAGVNYLSRSGALIFAPGQTNAVLRIPILDDGAVRGDQTIELELTNPQNGAMLGALTRATLIITDSEEPAVVDPSFDPGTGPTFGQSPGSISQLALEPDGKILVVGSFSTFGGIGRNGLVRLNGDGTVDLGFRAPSTVNGVNAMLVQSDGRIVVSAPGNGGNWIVSRLGTNGASDTTFHSASVSGSQYPLVQALALTSEGKILVAGGFNSINGSAPPRLVRLNADGTVDGGFKVDAVTYFVNGNDQSFVSQVLVQPDGNILIAGQFNSLEGVPLPGSARLNPDGALDRSFVLPGPGFGANALLVVRPDGKILMRGQNGMQLLNSDGSIDPTWNSAGISVQINSPGVVLQPDGKMVFLGNIYDSGVARSGVIRLNADGTWDSSVPWTQLTYTDSLNNATFPSTFALQADGEPIVVGSFWSVGGVPRAGIARLFGGLNGPRDMAFQALSSVVAEDAGIAVVTVQRLGDTTQAASVDYSTQDGTAIANLDYLPSHGTLEFAPLEESKSIVIPILDYPQPGADRSFTVALSHPSAGTVIDAGPATNSLTIADNKRPGSVDSGFAPVFEDTNAYSSGLSVAIQTDGKILVGGSFQRVNGRARIGICRLNTDGSLDPTFDPRGGLAFVNSDGSSSPITVQTVVLEADNRILVRGFFNTADGLPYTNLVRFNPDGSVDTAFVPDPFVQAGYFRNTSIAPEPDGHILAAGTGGLGRLQPDGSLDPEFTIISFSTSGCWGPCPFDVLSLPDGTALVQGDVDRGLVTGTGPARIFSRLNPDGTVDESYNPVADNLCVNAATVQPDGALIISGCFTQIGGVNVSGFARLNPDGTLDTSLTNTDIGTQASVLASDSGGRIFAAVNGTTIVRLNPNGAADTSFDSGSGVMGSIGQLVPQLDGKLLVAGSFTSFNGSARTNLVRLNGDALLTNAIPRFRTLSRGANGSVVLSLNAVPTQSMVLQTSTDLTTWSDLTKVTVTNYLQNVQDRSAASYPRRFYRARQAP